MTFEYSSDGKLLKSSDGLEFIYDLQGLAGVVDNSDSTAKTYFYRKDAQGNIVALLDENGAVVVKYVYNAWGEHKVLNPDGTENISASFIGNINPFRYRGYYYDTSLKLYYLVTRYYDPVVGRFISQDSLEYADPDTINGLNLYAYCNNNPVMNVDPTGHAFLVFLIAALIGFTISYASSVVSQLATSGSVNWTTAAIDGVFGAVSGALAMVPGLGVVATGLINAGLTAVNSFITTGIENDWQFSGWDFVTIAASAVLSGVASGIARNAFLKNGGREILKDTHKFVGKISGRIVSGFYNNGKDVISRSLKSAAGQMFKQLIDLNFTKDVWKDWLIAGLQALFSSSLSSGLNRLS